MLQCSYYYKLKSIGVARLVCDGCKDGLDTDKDGLSISAALAPFRANGAHPSICPYFTSGYFFVHCACADNEIDWEETGGRSLTARTGA